MKIKKSANTNRKPKVIIAIAVMVALLGGIIYFAYLKGIGPFEASSSNNSRSSDNVNDVDYGPPNETDIETSQNAKSKIFKSKTDDTETAQSENNEASTSNKKPVTIGVSYVDIYEGQLEVRAFTPSVIEGDGTCKVSVGKSGADTITVESSAFIDASSTICEPVFIPKSQLSTGTWTVNITYSSSAHEGSSGPVKVEVK